MHPGIICDFGLAKISTGSIAVDPKKQIHERTGLSPRYAAPEMFSKARTGFNSNHSVYFFFFSNNFNFFATID